MLQSALAACGPRIEESLNQLQSAFHWPPEYRTALTGSFNVKIDLSFLLLPNQAYSIACRLTLGEPGIGTTSIGRHNLRRCYAMPRNLGLRCPKPSVDPRRASYEVRDVLSAVVNLRRQAPIKYEPLARGQLIQNEPRAKQGGLVS